jgi:hypothetical protein
MKQMMHFLLNEIKMDASIPKYRNETTDVEILIFSLWAKRGRSG